MVMELWKVRIDQYCGFLSDQAAEKQQLIMMMMMMMMMMRMMMMMMMMMRMITQAFCKEILKRLWQQKC